ncbi:unnamed protein product [Penicillium salamii]|uniref:NACHT domain-containing protein n=1 Tax=Penicillium salamii TaxID=1612424 RepID=A0A9W4NWI2_9EURO|nr:unnamed protein product [Penicillium salamii]
MGDRNSTPSSSDFLQWLNPIDYTSQHAYLLEQRAEGTGEKLLSSNIYLTWLDTKSSTLFGTGMPGAGKTITSAIVVDNLKRIYGKEKDVGIAYLYCDPERNPDQSVKVLLASLLEQLCGGNPRFQNLARDCLGDVKDKPTAQQLDSISKALRLVASSYSRVFIVVDGLGEYNLEAGCRERLLSEIQSLKSKATINLFATARSTVAHECLKGCTSFIIEAEKEDIQRYLNSNIGQVPKFVGKDSPLQRDIEKSISLKAHGLYVSISLYSLFSGYCYSQSVRFLLAKLHFNYVVHRKTIESLRYALDEISHGSSQDAYNDAYDKTMRRVIDQSPKQRDLAIQSLAWVTLAKRPLKVKELQHALAIEKGAQKLNTANIPLEKDIISVCAGLLIVESGIIRLVHFTLQTYLEKTRQTWFKTFSEKDISSLCVAYLTLDAFRAGACDTDKARQARLDSHPSYEYAANHWGDHARKAHTDDPALMAFLENEPLVQACCSIKDSHRGRKGLHLAAKFGLDPVIRLLLNRGHNVNMLDTDASTPLMHASHGNHSTTVKLLLENGADVAAMNRHGRSALYWSAYNGNTEMRDVILRKSPKATKLDYVGAHKAALEQGHCELAKLLEKASLS